MHLVLLIVQLSFGTLAVESKLAMGPAHAVSPYALAMARIAGGAVFFIALALSQRSKLKLGSVRDVLLLAVFSLLGIVLNQVFFLEGLKVTSPVSAILLIATIPVFSAIIAVATRRDRLTVRGAMGIGIAFFGILVLTHFAMPRRGDALVLANSFCYSIYIVFSKGVLERYGATTVMAWVFGWALVLFAPIGGAAMVQEAPSWPLSTMALVLFIVLVPTVVAYWGNAWALARARPTLVTIYIYVQPLVVTVLAYVQLGQRVDAWAAVAGLFILLGVTVVATAKRNLPIEEAAASAST